MLLYSQTGRQEIIRQITCPSDLDFSEGGEIISMSEHFRFFFHAIFEFFEQKKKS